MEDINRELSKTDANSGRIYTSADLPTNKSKINVYCDGKWYNDLNYNSLYHCITGLKECHANHNARKGTKVKINSRDDGNFNLKYENASEIDNQSDNDSLAICIEELENKVNDYYDYFTLSEANVRTELINPLLKVLGWKFPMNIHQEVVCSTNSKLVDYALYKSDTEHKHFVVAIEAKSMCHIFTNPEEDNDVKQIKSYLKDKRFENSIGLLTNGLQWWLFDKDGDKPIIAKAVLTKRDEFKTFIEQFKYESFDIDKIIENAKSSTLGVDDVEIHARKNFYIIDNDEKIDKETIVDTFVDFVKKHIKDIKKYDENRCFKYDILLKKLGNRDTKTTKKNRVKLDDEILYITRDYSTYVKRALVQQIIHMCELENVTIYDKG